MTQSTHVFVKLEEYEDVLDIMNSMRTKLSEANRLLEEINTLKNQEDAEIEQWLKQLKEIDSRIMTVGKALFEPAQKLESKE